MPLNSERSVFVAEIYVVFVGAIMMFMSRLSPFLMFSSMLFSIPIEAKEGVAHAPAITNIQHDHWINKLTVGGLLEYELMVSKDFAGVKSSDGTLATVELFFDAKINDNVSAHLGFLYEEDETPVELDEGIISVALGSHVYINVGQMYLPFGLNATNLVSDTLTLEIGETRESAMLLGMEQAGFYGSLYVFNGSINETGKENKIDQAGLQLGFAREGESLSYDVGVSYMSNITDSEVISGYFSALPTPITAVKNYIPAGALHANINLGAMSFIAELVSVDKFQVTELAFNGAGAEPRVSNLELGYTAEIGSKEYTFALGWQDTDQALALGLPDSKILAGVSVGIAENTALSFEYSISDDYSISDGGTGKESSSAVLQLAVGF